ncbi:MAG: hypothetical protein Q9225_006191 [Loekoesia sp. 1 TL-2023]
MDSLSTKTNTKAFKKAIGTLPNTINELYDDAFRRIDSQNSDDQELAIKALQWVAYAYRPLTVHELKEALAIEPDDKDFEKDAMSPIDIVLEACAGLLIVDEETQQARLVHYTAQEYFDGLLDARFRNVHALVAGDCITYLSYNDFQSSKKSDIDDSSTISNHDTYQSSDESGDEHTSYYLLHYAAKFWAQHVTAGYGDSLSTQVCGFLASNPRMWLYYRLSEPFTTLLVNLETCIGIGIAAYFGLDDALSRLLQDEVGIDKKTYDGNSALHLAAHNDQVEAIDILLEHGADIECGNKYETTPLGVAIRERSVRVAYLLVERGANVMAVDGCGSGPFALVLWDSPIPFLQLVLDLGADINSQDGYGRTQLMHRAQACDLETMRWLLEKNALVNLKDDMGQTALFYASQDGSTEMVEFLLRSGADPSITDEYGQTLLHGACSNDDGNVVKQFLKFGINIDATDSYGETVLHVAAQGGHSECLNLLLANHADIDKQDTDGRTALHIAAQVGHGEFLGLLLANHADVDKQDTDGHTALHIAALVGHGESLDLLLANHAEVDKQDSHGRTPLMYAMEDDRTSIVHSLLNACANVDVQDSDGNTALHYAAAWGATRLVSEILKHDAIADKRNLSTLTLKHPSSIRRLRSCIVRCWMSDGQNDLISFLNPQIILDSEPRDILDILRDRRKILDCRVWRNGMTALDIAIMRNDAECISLLEPLTGSRTQSITMSFDEYICGLFGFSSVAELAEEMKRRKAEE